MLFDLIIISSLFSYFNSWILFFISVLIFKVITLFNSYINNVVNSDDFISNSLEFDESNSIYKCTNLNDCFKACDESTFCKNFPIIAKSFKPIKKYVIHPIEYTYSKSTIIFVPQGYDVIDSKIKLALKKMLICIWNLQCTNKLKLALKNMLVYIWNLQCSNNLKSKLTNFIMKESLKHMSQFSQSNQSNQRNHTISIQSNVPYYSGSGVIRSGYINYSKKAEIPENVANLPLDDEINKLD